MTEQTETNRPESIIELLAQILLTVQHRAINLDGEDIDIGGEIGRLRRLYDAIQTELNTANVERCELQDRINELEEELDEYQRADWIG